MKKVFVSLSVLSLAVAANAQILLSGGLSYSQNFDSLGNSPVNTNPTWTDNTTIPGWYASRSYTGGTATALGNYAYTSYRIDAGTANSGLLYSYGVAGVNPVTDRALGSLASGTPKTNVFGVRIANDTASAVDSLTISYTGEQWRNGGNTAIHTLAFAYQVSASPFTSPISTDNVGWTAFSALNFLTPTVGATAGALDGNDAANRTIFSNIVLTGVTLNPGQEIFLRWLDLDDSGSDHGFGVDDFSVTASLVVPEPTTAALGGLAMLVMLMARRNRR